jgi:metaxin
MATAAASKYVPKPILSFFSLFPLHTYPPIPPPRKTVITQPTLWILPPRNSDVEQTSLLSSDIECLKWQAYLALRGVKHTILRWDITPDGAIDRHLPNLHIPLENPEKDDGSGDILAAHMIPGWVDAHMGESGELEGYKDEKSKDESRAWVSLLEGDVHNAFVRL